MIQALISADYSIGKRCNSLIIKISFGTSFNRETLYISSSEQSVGKIVNAERHPDGGAVALAVIQISSAEAEHIHWQSQQGEQLQLMELPYSIPEK